MKLPSARSLIISASVFSFTLLAFLFINLNQIKPTQAATANCPDATTPTDNCATNLQITSQTCDQFGNPVVKFGWTTAPNPYILGGTSIPVTLQYLDYTDNSAATNTAWFDSHTPVTDYYSFNAGVGYSSATLPQIGYPMNPGTTYHWRINTRYSLLGTNTWSPSIVPASFTVRSDCAQAAASCTYSFSLPNNTIASGNTFNVSVTINVPPANANDTIETGFALAAPPNTHTNWIQIPGTPQTVTLTAPTVATNTQYLVYSSDINGGLCALQAGSSLITVTPAGGSTCTNNTSSAAQGGSDSINHGAGMDFTTHTYTFGIKPTSGGSGIALIGTVIASVNPSIMTIPSIAAPGIYTVYASATPLGGGTPTTTDCTGSTLTVTTGGGGNVGGSPTCKNNTPTVAAGGAINVTFANINVTDTTVAVVITYTSGNTKYPLWGNITTSSGSSNFGVPDGAIAGTYNVVIVVAPNNGGAAGFVGCGALRVIPATNNATLCKSFTECLAGIATPNLKYTQPRGLIGTLLTDIIPIILMLAGFLTVIIIIISGLQFIISSGDPESAAKARSRLIFAIIGFIVIILAFAILRIIDMLFLGTTGILP